MDAQGNLYIADNGNNCVRLVTTAGIITTYAGTTPGSGTWSLLDNGDGGPATGTSAGFSNLFGLAFDRSDNLYIADSGGK